MITVQKFMDCGCALLRGRGVRRCPRHDAGPEPETDNAEIELELHRQREREREQRIAGLAITRQNKAGGGRRQR